MDANQTAGEKNRQKLHKNVESSIEQVLATTPHNTPTIRTPITKTIQVRRTRHAGHCWRSKDELKAMYSCGLPHMDVQKQDGQYELTYSNYVRTQDVTLKTCRRWWMIGRSGERGSGISVLAARHDDDDDDFINRFQFSWFDFHVCLPLD